MIAGVPGKDPSGMEGPFDKNSPAGKGGGYLTGGIGWYRKTFTLPESSRARRGVGLLFDGAYMDSQVWLNGKLVGARPYGYSSFYVDLSADTRFGSEKKRARGTFERRAALFTLVFPGPASTATSGW